MTKLLTLNIAINSATAIAFLLLNMYFLSQGFEETFISAVTMYGLVVVISNAFFVAKVLKK